MPHAVFIETDVDGGAGVVAYAAELPGCAVFGATPDDAAAAMPRRVSAFSEWLADAGAAVPAVVGDNWYEVERASAAHSPDAVRRAAFSLDDLPPGDEEFERWLGWMELAREELASAIDAAGPVDPDRLEAVTTQDLALAERLGAAGGEPAGDAVDRLYAARDRLTDALIAAGPSGDGVRRAIRLAIADDLQLARRLRGGTD